MSTYNPLSVEPTFFTWRGHNVAHYVAGQGPQVLLVHSINAAASAFEMRKPFEQLQDRFEVHAIDLLGYGRSDRPAQPYVADDYVALLQHMVQQLGRGTIVIASSLGAAYAVKAAVASGENVRALVLICPVGLKQLATPPTPRAFALYRVISGYPGDALFSGLTTRASMRFYLERQAYADPASVTDEVIDGFYQTTRLPGAKYAPLSFVTGLLNCNITKEFSQLLQPIQIVWGREAKTTPLSQADAFLQGNPRARLAVIDRASLLVQDERPDEFMQIVRNFLL